MMTMTLHEYIVYSTDFRNINSPAFYDCIIHLICTCGEGSFMYNGRPFALRANEIAVISHPMQISSIASSPDFECAYIAAPDKFLHNLLPANNYAIQGGVSLFANPIIPVTADDAGRFIRDLDNIRCRMDDVSHKFYVELMGGLLQAMVYDLFDFHAKNNDNVLTTERMGYIVRQFFSLIESGSPRCRRDVSYYADMLNVTPKYLSDTVKKVTGRSVSVHINNAAVSIMIDYLKDSKLSVTQIADEMNFSSVSHLSRYCRRHTGMSPAQYRIAGVKG